MTNYMVCLSHFCEVHGPAAIICTQRAPSGHKQQYLLPRNSKRQTCASCKLMFPNDATNLMTASEDGSSFISTQYPSSQTRYKTLTKLVMKSLSAETTANMSTPIFHGDATNGYCIIRLFKTRDINARGAERKYSLMVVCDSELALVNDWAIIVTYLHELISLIQESVDKSIERSEGLNNEFYLRRSLVRPKSLAELTEDPQLFVKFHLWAAELLGDIGPER